MYLLTTDGSYSLTPRATVPRTELNPLITQTQICIVLDLKGLQTKNAFSLVSTALYTESIPCKQWPPDPPSIYLHLKLISLRCEFTQQQQNHRLYQPHGAQDGKRGN